MPIKSRSNSSSSFLTKRPFTRSRESAKFLRTSYFTFLVHTRLFRFSKNLGHCGAGQSGAKRVSIAWRRHAQGAWACNQRRAQAVALGGESHALLSTHRSIRRLRASGEYAPMKRLCTSLPSPAAPATAPTPPPAWPMAPGMGTMPELGGGGAGAGIIPIAWCAPGWGAICCCPKPCPGTP